MGNRLYLFLIIISCLCISLIASYKQQSSLLASQLSWDQDSVLVTNKRDTYGTPGYATDELILGIQVNPPTMGIRIYNLLSPSVICTIESPSNFYNFTLQSEQASNNAYYVPILVTYNNTL